MCASLSSSLACLFLLTFTIAPKTAPPPLTGDDDIIRLIHTAGKYPEIVKTMEAINNCGIYNRAVTFYDLDINGIETFCGGPTLSGKNDLGIRGCWRTTA